MRNNRKSTDSADRLGPLASLMRTAEPLDQLSASERERIKLRLRGELARNRSVTRMRLLTAMAGFGLLLAGGVAMAGRLGLIRWPGVIPASPARHESVSEEPRRPSRGHPKAVAPAALDDQSPNHVEIPVAPVPAAAAVPEPVPPTPKIADDQAKPSLPGGQNTRARRASESAEPTRPPDVPSKTSSHEPRAVSPSSPLEPAPSLPPAPRSTPTTSPLAMVAPEDFYHRIPKTAPASTANPTPNAQELLGQAMRSLRRQHDPAAALDLLGRHAALFPQSPLAGERTQLEVEALLALGRHSEALLRLDSMELGQIPRAGERRVIRGELRAQARRWSEAAADFDQAMVHLKDRSPWQERALWGRALARAHAGDRAGSRTDLRLYLQTFPQGRFAGEASRLADQP